jgi:hypothetical protein
MGPGRGVDATGVRPVASAGPALAVASLLHEERRMVISAPWQRAQLRERRAAQPTRAG